MFGGLVNTWHSKHHAVCPINIGLVVALRNIECVLPKKFLVLRGGTKNELLDFLAADHGTIPGTALFSHYCLNNL